MHFQYPPEKDVAKTYRCSITEPSIDEEPAPPQSPYPEDVDPSPVESNGTANTDLTQFDDDAIETRSIDSAQILEATTGILFSPIALLGESPRSPDSLARLDTSVDNKTREEPESGTKTVIATPEHFRQSFVS